MGYEVQADSQLEKAPFREVFVLFLKIWVPLAFLFILQASWFVDAENEKYHIRVKLAEDASRLARAHSVSISPIRLFTI